MKKLLSLFALGLSLNACRPALPESLPEGLRNTCLPYQNEEGFWGLRCGDHVLLPAEFDAVQRPEGHPDLFLLKQGQHIAIYDSKGQRRLEGAYSKVEIIHNPYQKGSRLFLLNAQKTYGLANEQGQILIPLGTYVGYALDSRSLVGILENQKMRVWDSLEWSQANSNPTFDKTLEINPLYFDASLSQFLGVQEQGNISLYTLQKGKIQNLAEGHLLGLFQHYLFLRYKNAKQEESLRIYNHNQNLLTELQPADSFQFWTYDSLLILKQQAHWAVLGPSGPLLPEAWRVEKSNDAQIHVYLPANQQHLLLSSLQYEALALPYELSSQAQIFFSSPLSPWLLAYEAGQMQVLQGPNSRYQMQGLTPKANLQFDKAIYLQGKEKNCLFDLERSECQTLKIADSLLPLGSVLQCKKLAQSSYLLQFEGPKSLLIHNQTLAEQALNFINHQGQNQLTLLSVVQSDTGTAYPILIEDSKINFYKELIFNVLDWELQEAHPKGLFLFRGLKNSGERNFSLRNAQGQILAEGRGLAETWVLAEGLVLHSEAGWQRFNVQGRALPLLPQGAWTFRSDLPGGAFWDYQSNLYLRPFDGQ